MEKYQKEVIFEIKAEYVKKIYSVSLFVLRGLIPKNSLREGALGRFKKVLNPECKYLIRTTYPVPLGRGC